MAMPPPAVLGRFFRYALVLALAASAPLPAAAKDVSLRRWPERVAAPALNLTDLDGREWNAERLRGKVVVLNFWASWCEPCVDEMAYLNELANNAAGQDKPLVLGVNFKESASAVQAFTGKHKVDYPILLDRSGERFNQWADGVLPTTILIDRRGRPRWRIVGELDRTDPRIKKLLQTLLAER